MTTLHTRQGVLVDVYARLGADTHFVQLRGAECVSRARQFVDSFRAASDDNARREVWQNFQEGRQ